MIVVFRRLKRPFLPVTFALSLLLAPLVSPASAQAPAPVSATVAAAKKTELVALVQESHVNDIWPSKLIGTVNFKLSAPAWKTLLSKEGVTGAARLGRNMGSYIKQQEIGDLERIETANNNDRKSTQDEVDELIAAAKTKVGLTIEATQPKLSPLQSQTLLNYISGVGGFLDRASWTPRGGRANIKLIFSSSAKDIAVMTSKDATNFTVIAPTKVPIDWSNKMEKGLKRGGK
jgi:hypothetical protein